MRDGLLLEDWNGTETKETPTCALDHLLYRYLGKAVWWVPRKDITEHVQRGKNCIKLKCIPSQQDFYLLFLEIKTGTREERSSFLGLGCARENVWLTLTLLMLPKVSVHRRGYGAQFLTHSQPRPGVCCIPVSRGVDVKVWIWALFKHPGWKQVLRILPRLKFSVIDPAGKVCKAHEAVYYRQTDLFILDLC